MPRSMILLVSAQPMANLLTALAPELDIGEVHLLVSGEMQAAAGHLCDVMEARKITCKRHDNLSEPFRPEQTRALVASILATRPADDFVVNVTGGTKPMAMGAYRAAIEAGVQDIIYMDHEDGHIRYLDSDNRPFFPVTVALQPQEVAQAHGFDSRQAKAASPGNRAFAQQMFAELQGRDLQAWNRLMAAVGSDCARGRDWYANPVSIERASTKSDNAHPWSRKNLDALLTEACRKQYCGWDGKHLTIKCKEDHDFLAGKWFELVAADALQQLAPRLALRDIASNFEVTSRAGKDGKPVVNEADVVAMQGRHLLVFECKTSRMHGTDKAEQTKTIFYKLDHLRKLGGHGTRLFLLSCDRADDWIRARYGNERGVWLVDGLQPANLQQKLEEAIARAVA